MDALIVGSRDRQLADLLQPLVARVSTAESLRALTAATSQASPPGLVVVDLRAETLIPLELSTVRRLHPATGIIIVATRLDPAMMLEAIRAGANEFLVEPLSQADVRSAIERVAVLAPQEQGKSYAFVGGKGGVGTTTLAVNVATALAASRAGRVLFVDFHSAHGDAALFFGAEPRFSVLDALQNTHRLDAAFLRGLVATTGAGVDLLASPDAPTAVQMNPQHVRTLLGLVSGHYSHIVVDVSRSDSALLDALEPAHAIVVVANQELATIRGASRMAAALRQRYGKERVQVVISRYETQGSIGREDIERATGGAIRHLFPSDYRLAVDALNHGCPLVVQNHSGLAASFTGFAMSLAGVRPPVAEAAKPSGIFGRLKGGR